MEMYSNNTNNNLEQIKETQEVTKEQVKKQKSIGTLAKKIEKN